MNMPEQKVTMEEVVALCKSRGFVFPGSEIYGGLANSWDYGPLGVELLNNIKKAFWEYFVYGRDDVVGLDSAILMNPKVWEASGHVTNFSDPLVDCKECKSRFRGDKLVEEYFYNNYGYGRSFPEMKKDITGEATSMTGEDYSRQKKEGLLSSEDYKKKIIDLADTVRAVENNDSLLIHHLLSKWKIACPSCGKCNWTEPKQFNLMFKTRQGVTEDSGMDIYLRPETAQGIFVNFKNIERTARKKLPFGVAQIGKAFRNEITPGNFIFRTREFEQMEIEYFFDPERTEWEKLFAEWKETTTAFVRDVLGIRKENFRLRDHEKDELSHYSKGTTDIEYNFPFGWGELCATGAYRTDYDLKQHEQHSKQELKYLDPDSGKKIAPHVIEPSLGVGRLALALLIDAYNVEKLENEERVVLKFNPRIAPVKVAVLPLMKKDGLAEKSKEVKHLLKSLGNIEYDETASIGKRYRRQDEIGTPVCVTVDYDTLKDETVTVRDRDTMQQERIKLSELLPYVNIKYFNLTTNS